MPLPRLSKEAGQLVRDIGAGRRLQEDDCTLTLRYSSGGGDGLVLSAQLEGQPVKLWLDQDQWCQWISKQLPVHDWYSVSPELHEVLASWTLACVSDSLIYSGLTWPTGLTIEAANVPIALYSQLEIQQDDRRLKAWVLEAPMPWLTRLAAAFSPIDDGEQLGNQSIAVALIAGWGRIDQQTLSQLEPGDGLLLQQSYAVADGTLGLFLHRPLATLVVSDYATYTVENVMDEFDDWLDATPDATTATSPQQPDVFVSVVAQVASIDMPLQQLASLQVGDVLEGSTRLEDGVVLKVAGRTIGHGLLLNIEGRLVVRIERLI
ncbi:type III secretion system cytoplasmic ring protein SctQ [Pseudomonas zeae]|uniref:type III secretion system cytoplasmic ring protein SctQ n=1 Tax=Pseudomonas zeae TaxID=2745510 RepID=UPI0039E0ED88